MPRMKNKGLFGKKPSFAMPSMQPEMPMGGGMNDLQTIMHSPQERQAAQPPMPVNDPKAGLGTRLFGQGWEDKAFALGGIMQGDPTGAYMMRQDKQAEQKARAEAAAEQRKRAMDLADFEYKKRFEWQNAPEPNNDTVRDFEWYQNLSEDERRLYHQMKPQMQIGPDGRPYYVNPYGNSPQVLGSELPQGWTVEGGTASNGGGPFRR